MNPFAYSLSAFLRLARAALGRPSAVRFTFRPSPGVVQHVTRRTMLQGPAGHEHGYRLEARGGSRTALVGDEVHVTDWTDGPAVPTPIGDLPPQLWRRAQVMAALRFPPMVTRLDRSGGYLEADPAGLGRMAEELRTAILGEVDPELRPDLEPLVDQMASVHGLAASLKGEHARGIGWFVGEPEIEPGVRYEVEVAGGIPMLGIEREVPITVGFGIASQSGDRAILTLEMRPDLGAVYDQLGELLSNLAGGRSVPVPEPRELVTVVTMDLEPATLSLWRREVDTRTRVAVAGAGETVQRTTTETIVAPA